MNVALFGGTGDLGLSVAREAVRRGHRLAILARDPNRVDSQLGARCVKGDARDQSAVEAAIEDADVVISALGGPPKGTVMPAAELLHHATETIVVAMQKAGVKRLLYTSAWGVGDSRARVGPMMNYVIRPIVVKDEYADKEIQEEIIMRSPLDWTVVRPTVLTNGDPAAARALSIVFQCGAGSRRRRFLVLLLLLLCSAKPSIHGTFEKRS